MLNDQNRPMDAAAKLGIDNPYSIVAPFYGFYLERGL